MAAQTTWMQKRGKLARLSRDLPADHPDIVALRTELKLDRAAEYITKLIADTPPLTDEQRTRLTELLKPVRVAGGAAPPTRSSAPAPSGGTTSTENLIKAAHLVLDECGITLSPSKVSRIVRDYQRNVAPNGFGFFPFLATAVQLSEGQKQTALLNPEIARAISYADPTGETAVNRVIRGGGR